MLTVHGGPVVKGLRKLLLILAAAVAPSGLAFAANEPVIVQAELGTFGAEFAAATDATGVQYAFCTTNLTPPGNGANPGIAARVASYDVTFPAAGNYELYARVWVGPGGGDDDSFFYGNRFGAKNPVTDNDWITTNNLGSVGFTALTATIVGNGTAGGQAWKWVKLSTFNGGEAPVATWVVPNGVLTQTFQIGGREDGLRFDKFAFGVAGSYYTVSDLNNGTAPTGTAPPPPTPPPPPYTPPGPAIATGKPKFLGGVSSPAQDLNLRAYWNQITPENAGKWGSVEGTRNVMNWGQLDTAYNLAKNATATDGSALPVIPFRFHTLIWGNQQPGWIEPLPPAEQLAEIRQWFQAVADRYPLIDFIDVVNEPLHDPPNLPGNGGGNYINALGGAGTSGWDWVLNAFRMAREIFPNAKLGINEYSVTNDGNLMTRYLTIINLLRAENLIDTVGVQGHAFSTTGPNTTTISNLNRLAETGLPIYVTELDIDGLTDDVQLPSYQRIFPAFWEHPGVRGITLWGYRPGHWREAQGAQIVFANGAERAAMKWLIGYVANAVLPPWITQHPDPQTATVENTVTFTVAGDGSAPLTYAWRKDGTPITGNDSAATATLTLPSITTADAGSYDAVVSNPAGSAVSHAALLTVNKAVAAVTLANLSQTYDGTPRAVSAVTSPPGLTIEFTYDGSPAAPVNAGSYAVTATVNDVNYVGSDEGVLTVAPATATITLGDLVQTYDGSPKVVSVLTAPSGLPVSVTYNGGPAPPVNTGAYAVEASVTDPNYVGSASAVLIVQKAPALVALGDLSAVYDGAPHAASVATLPLGLPVIVTYDGSLTPPTAAGSYAVNALVDHPNYAGGATGTLTIGQASAAVTLGALTQVYDGTPKSVTVTTSPAGLTVDVTYNGSATPPTGPGSYAVVATINEANYSGSATGTLVITTKVIVRHAPTINGTLGGSLQLLLPESTTLNGSARVSGDLLVPGSPTVKPSSSYEGTLEGPGNASPSNYTVTLNGGAVLRHVVRRTNAASVPSLTAPPSPAGTRDVVLNSAGQGVGNFATLRNLILNSNVGQVAMPAGTYGSLTANSGSGFALGERGATTPSVYNLQGLTLNGGSRLQILGPVVLKIAGGVTVNASVGDTAHPEWLQLLLPSGGLTLNGGSAVNGYVVAPAGTVMINGAFKGGLVADRLTINGGGSLSAE